METKECVVGVGYFECESPVEINEQTWEKHVGG